MFELLMTVRKSTNLKIPSVLMQSPEGTVMLLARRIRKRETSGGGWINISKAQESKRRDYSLGHFSKICPERRKAFLLQSLLYF